MYFTAKVATEINEMPGKVRVGLGQGGTHHPPGYFLGIFIRSSMDLFGGVGFIWRGGIYLEVWAAGIICSFFLSKHLQILLG